jgi:hypothetical protein
MSALPITEAKAVPAPGDIFGLTRLSDRTLRLLLLLLTVLAMGVLLWGIGKLLQAIALLKFGKYLESMVPKTMELGGLQKTTYDKFANDAM